MRPTFSVFRSAAASPLVLPALLGIFLLLYIVTAFSSNEPLTTLLAQFREEPLLAALFALIPLNLAWRLAVEASRELALRRAVAGQGAFPAPALCDESVELLPVDSLEPLQARLELLGYGTRCGGEWLSAARGVSLFPVRLLMLAGMLSLFTGVLLSLTSRESSREAFIEGERFQLPSGGGALVQRIVLGEQPGLLLERSLSIEVVADSGAGRSFGLYPPSRLDGFYVYPRYLGIVPLLRFSAPDLPAGFESYLLLMIYPAGREDTAEIPGTPYRIAFRMAPGADGRDPFVTGRLALECKLFRGKELLFEGVAPVGGELARDGYRLAFPEFKRMAATDLVRDRGIALISGGGVLLSFSLVLWLPLRLFFPRRELFFLQQGGVLRAASRAEGKRRSHAGEFHEALDLLGGERPAAGGPLPDST